MNICTRCQKDDELTDCLDCHKTFCAICDEDDLNNCEYQFGVVCAGCQEDHLSECEPCRRAVALDYETQRELDYRRGK